MVIEKKREGGALKGKRGDDGRGDGGVEYLRFASERCMARRKSYISLHCIWTLGCDHVRRVYVCVCLRR